MGAFVSDSDRSAGTPGTGPLVVYIGGGTGTGKSTLALALAPRLGLHRVLPTDAVREILRAFVPAAADPTLHRSSFETGDRTAPSAGPLAGFDSQSRTVLRGVRAAVQRSVSEGVGMIVEGVHLWPPLVPLDGLPRPARQVVLLLATRDEAVHRQRFLERGGATGRPAERYLANFAAIRRIHDRLIERAEAHGVPVVDTSPPEPPVRILEELVKSR
ncbi:MAG: hypothetical protein D6718_09485 [Acidobacteria bacterium]|nr:MAG: hypothetical protein D6718_09485 [Acidobacteriota bacterium]